MIQDLTNIRLRSLNRKRQTDHRDLFKPESEYYSYKDCRASVLTGTATQRTKKRQTALQYEHQCECCGRFYTPKPWAKTWGLCDECYALEYQEQKLVWRTKAVNNTQQIRDLWNRCY